MSLLASDSALPHSRPMLPAAAELQLGAWNAALPALKLSFRDALAATSSVDSKSGSKSAELALSLQLPMPSLLRDTSTASTPTGTITPAAEEDWQSSASSRSCSPLMWGDDVSSPSPSSHSRSSCADDCCDWCPELVVDYSQPPLDLSVDVEVDFEALELEAREEAAAAEEAECRLAEAAAASAVDLDTELSWRQRHRFSVGLARDPYELNRHRYRGSDRAVAFYAGAGKSGTRIHHLRAAAAGHNRNGNRVAATKGHSLVPNPYDALVEQDKPKRETEPEPSRRANGKDGQQRLARTKVQTESRSLAAAGRPAMVHASAAFRTVIRERTARKQHLKQTASALRPALPQHLRPRSRGCGFARSEAVRVLKATAIAASPLPPPASRSSRSESEELSTAMMRQGCSFEHFRRAFYHKHRAAIESSLTGSRRVTDVRLAPIGECARSRFMQRLRALAPSAHHLPLTFHGTKIANMDSICRKGLLVPNRGNGVRVENGSAYGVGIYTCRNADYPTSFSNCQTLFVCAAITAGCGSGGRDSSACVVSGDVVVLMDEARVVPLFLMDFAPTAAQGAPGVGTSTQISMPGAPPSISLDLLRRMLAAAHAKQRKHQAHVASMFMRALDCSHYAQ